MTKIIFGDEKMMKTLNQVLLFVVEWSFTTKHVSWAQSVIKMQEKWVMKGIWSALEVMVLNSTLKCKFGRLLVHEPAIQTWTLAVWSILTTKINLNPRFWSEHDGLEHSDPKNQSKPKVWVWTRGLDFGAPSI